MEFSKMIGPLTDPVAHGGRAEDAFQGFRQGGAARVRVGQPAGDVPAQLVLGDGGERHRVGRQGEERRGQKMQASETLELLHYGLPDLTAMTASRDTSGVMQAAE